MRIDTLHIKNFKGFADATFDFKQFNLIVGENGAGKTSILDALAVASGIWLAEPPDSSLSNSGRNIYPSEIRLVPVQQGDRLQFQEASGGVSIEATGRVGETEPVIWKRQIRAGGKRTTNAEAKKAQVIIADYFARDGKENDGVITHLLFPVIAYYGAGRAWLPSRDRSKNKTAKSPAAKRWGAFYDSLFERLRPAEIQGWFESETIAQGNRKGLPRPGYEVVRQAVLGCVPEADAVYFDGDRKEIVFSINKRAQPFSNLSAGQRMLLSLVADLAIKAVTQNNYLVPAEKLQPEDAPLPRVLKLTPGVVLIDELDVHLHPRWQRSAVENLKKTFPSMQFFATTHSPQIVSETPADEIIVLNQDGSWTRPHQTIGLSSNQVLQDIMGASAINQGMVEKFNAIFTLVEKGEFDAARAQIADLRGDKNYQFPELIEAESYMEAVDAAAKEEQA